MSARKWPFYTIAVGESIVIDKPPKCIQSKVYKHAARAQKKFSVKRVERFRTKSPVLIRRVA